MGMKRKLKKFSKGARRTYKSIPKPVRRVLESAVVTAAPAPVVIAVKAAKKAAKEVRRLG